MIPDKIQIKQLRFEFETELYESVIPFWEDHSPDRENGGYYNHIDQTGNIYDKTKNVWLLGRQVWMFSKLYRNNPQRNNYLQIAKLGIDFLRKNARDKSGRVYFSLAENGRPVYLQRKIFSECFYAMALSEYAKATDNKEIKEEADEVYQFIWKMIRDPILIGRPIYKGAPKLQMLGIPMIMLNVIEEIAGKDYHKYLSEIVYCIDKMKAHYIDGVMYEFIDEDNNIHDSAQGRLLNPGHAIEAGWFLIHWAEKLKDRDLYNMSAQIIRDTFDRSWDTTFGGIFYFMDSQGNSPIQLEWDMKLWWPHCEAMYAFLLLYKKSGSITDWNNFVKIKEYAFEHYSDPEFGEWFGYLNRRGEVTHKFKGGPYKGCFHVPRTLMLCGNTLKEIETGI